MKYCPSIRSRIALGTLAALVSLAVATAPTKASARNTNPDTILQRIDVEQKLGTRLPLDTTFRDSRGGEVRFGDLLDGKPVILAFVYYECPMLCTLVLNGLTKALRPLSMDPGEDFDVIVVSFDPGETSELAEAKKAAYIESYGRPETADGWHFLTGDEADVAELSESAGFRYVYDPDRDEYAHAAAIMVATPEGDLARYLFGIEYSTRDVRLALVEASEGKIGTIVDRFLLFCYHYDPATGRYSAVAMNMVRAGGVVTVGALSVFWIAMRRRERRLSP